MSKRLNKRQQREQEELELLKAEQARVQAATLSGNAEQGLESDDRGEDAHVEAEEKEEEEASTGAGAPLNAFAALGGDGDDQDEEESEEEVEPEVVASSTKKSKKKKNKKKKKASTTATPGNQDEQDDVPRSEVVNKNTSKAKSTRAATELDDVDRALAELDLKYGSAGDTIAAQSSQTGAAESKGSVAFRKLLSVDPKNLDADAELRRFFGSKVIASEAASNKRRGGGPSAKLRYTISKPKANYPPPSSLAGLGMRELRDEEVVEWYERRGYEGGPPGEKWFTFEQTGQWREITRQFLGAVRSHDPNELQALLSVYPWHVDTLLQMSEVYRLQSDIGAASDYAERALYAFDRCLAPSFSVMTGSSRLDFDRIENRPMFTALHRIISRGCWVTAFNFAKLLFSLDPQGDPHGAALWLDFLAIKSGNSAWLLSMFEQEEQAAVAFDGYPGMAYAKALALRNQEIANKSKDRSASEVALQAALWTFPQVIPLLADKIGASLPAGVRSHPLMAIEAGYIDTPLNTVHLLSHIYVARSEALWKDADMLSFFESQVPLAMAQLETSQASSDRDHVLSLLDIPRDPIDEQLKLPLFLCRHVVCSESTSWIGFLPPVIRNKPVHAYDPLPPTTAISVYNDAFFSGVPTRNSNSRGLNNGGAAVEGNGVMGFARELMGRLTEAQEGPQEGLRERIQAVWRDLVARPEMDHVPEADRENLLQQILEAPPPPNGRQGGMPGAFPGQEDGGD